ncbi:nitrogenase iron protein [Desulfosarcina ovata subsp. sediminis]|uniref:Nitrogenase iron protein n=1 Tax=Desulfosarcina ovata subsp. sediminis TaxID=885957 RepID=A0A5K7ZIL0_9BACT|nr:nitrogenase iron protein NifH [Desulfosarcina ovata]BBO81962.1 nitrogenase iron protein [Desulfosarcina ovata subsp. sediminis]
MKTKIKIGIYGKGGIGKSTIASNLSAAFSKAGLRVLHIGCDPKADSTRNLMGGRIPTVLGTLRNGGYSLTFYKENDFVFNGFDGVACVEAGGPEPGVGCAGRGIITMVETLEQMGVFNNEWDVTVYDVLGDVVCGGFAVPVRKGYAEKIYIVTSGEFMPLYAANNICNGISKFAKRGGAKLGGIIYNCRGAKGDSKEVVYEFAKAVGSEVIADIPRSDFILKAETEMTTVIESYPDSDIAHVFQDAAQKIIDDEGGEVPQVLSDEQMETMSKQIATSVMNL